MSPARITRGSTPSRWAMPEHTPTSHLSSVSRRTSSERSQPKKRSSPLRCCGGVPAVWPGFCVMALMLPSRGRPSP